jgi:hypothetical protein
MLYLVLFSTLALGFYAATTTAVQVSNNDSQVSRAFLASESGLDFMRYHLAHVSISAFSTDVTTELANDLKDRLEPTGNMSGLTVGVSGTVINIPAEPNKYVKLDAAGSGGFRATITDWPEQGKVVMKVIGRYGTTTVARAIQMDFTRVPKEPSIFDFAVASKGQIVMKKHAVTSLDPNKTSEAKMMSAMSATPSVLVTGGEIGGKVTIVTDDPTTEATEHSTIVVTGGTVAGETNAAAIVADTTARATNSPPAFPEFNTEVYRTFASSTTTGAAGNTVLKNVRIPAGSNPTFNGDATLQGIMYVESPNEVTINGSLNLNGFIVFEGEGDSSVNSLSISGNITTGPLPSSSEFDPIRSASGVAILAPTTALKLTGSARGMLKGNVITSTFLASGTPATVIIEHGSLITLEETAGSATFDGKTIKFNGTGANNLPKVGMGFAAAYDPEPESYEELMP